MARDFHASRGSGELYSRAGRGGAEATIVNAVLWLKLAVETTGAIVIGLGVVAAYKFARSCRRSLNATTKSV